MPSEEPTTRSRVFDGMERFLAASGVVFQDLLLHVGLDFDLVSNFQDAFIPINKVAAFFEVAAHATGKPCFGIEFADIYPLGGAGAYGFLIANAPTVKDALTCMETYLPNVSRGLDANFSIEAEGVGCLSWSMPVSMTAPVVQYATYAHCVVIKRLRWSAGMDWVPLRVDCAHREVPCRELYTRFFGSRVRFDQPLSTIYFDPTTLARRSTTANERLYRAMQSACAAELETVSTKRDAVNDVRRVIQRRLGDGAPSLEAIAQAMRLTARQLQWKLEQDETTFEKEVSETRRLLAERLLTSTDLTMTQIAAAVGFSELSSFTRACSKTWFGVSPREYRASAVLNSSRHAA